MLRSRAFSKVVEERTRLETTPNFTLELESREAISAVVQEVARGSRQQEDSRECYRCLTTSSKRWHEYGQLHVTMCNGCVVLMDCNVCGWCGTAEDNDGQLAFNCSRCLRPEHATCTQRLRGKPNCLQLCVVCELKERIKRRAYAKHINLIPADLSSLLNYHIFSFASFFPGACPGADKNRTSAVKSGTLPEISTENFESEEGRGARMVQAAGLQGPSTKRQRHGAKSSLARLEKIQNAGAGFAAMDRGFSHRIHPAILTAASFKTFDFPKGQRAAWMGAGGSKMRRTGMDKLIDCKVATSEAQTFDNLLKMTARDDLHVTEKSKVLDAQRTLREQWEANTRNNAQRAHRMHNVKATQAILEKRIEGKESLAERLTEPLNKMLIDLGLCYFTRPFRDGAGGSSFLKTSEVFVRFAQDFNLVPGIITLVQCQDLVYKTLSANPIFADGFKELLHERELQKRRYDQRVVMASSSTAKNRLPDNSLKAHDVVLEEASTRERFSFLGAALHAFMLRVAIGRNRKDASLSETAVEEEELLHDDGLPLPLSRNASLGIGRSFSHFVKNVMRLNEQTVTKILLKYPTQSELDQALEVEHAAAERRSIETAVAMGRRRPYPLETTSVQSEEMSVWMCRLAEIFDFFVNPIRLDMPLNLDDPLFLIGQTFRFLDRDLDGIISRLDATEAMIAAGCSEKDSAYLVDVLMWTVPKHRNEDGITWEEFSHTPSSPDNEEQESIGACWRLLMEEYAPSHRKRTIGALKTGSSSPADAMALRAVQIQQRDVGKVFIQSTGQLWGENTESLGGNHAVEEGHEWIHGEHRGMGAIFKYDGEGRTVVYMVARPGPAADKLWKGDTIIAINGENVDAKGPGEVISMLIAAGNEEADIMLTVKRGEDEEDENLHRVPPATQPPIPRSMRAHLEAPKGEIGFSSILKAFSMFGLLPGVVIADEVRLLCAEIKTGHVVEIDGEMMLSFDEFRAFLLLMMEHDRFNSIIKSRITWPIGKSCLQRLTEREQPLGALFIFMQLPREAAPGGAGWIKIRYYLYVEQKMASWQKEADDMSASAVGSNAEEKIVSMFPDANVLVQSDGVSEYFAACKVQHLAPHPQITSQLLSMNPRLKLDGLQLRGKQAIALMAGLIGNHHVQHISFKNIGLDSLSVSALSTALTQSPVHTNQATSASISAKVQTLDLSRNPVLFATAQRSVGGGVTTIKCIIKIINVAQILSTLRLAEVGLGDHDARALCDALVATKRRPLRQLDLSSNRLCDLSSKKLARLVLKYDGLSYLNLTWNLFGPAGTGVVLKAVRTRERLEAEERARKAREAAENDAASAALFATPKISRRMSRFPRGDDVGASESEGIASRGHSRQDMKMPSRASLAVELPTYGPFGPREGMYDFDRLLDKTDLQTVEYLDHIRTTTRWDGAVPSPSDPQISDKKIIVLFDTRVETLSSAKTTQSHTKCKCLLPSSPTKFDRAGSSTSKTKPSLLTGPTNVAEKYVASTNASLSAVEKLIDQNEYLDLKALLEEETSDGLQLIDRLALLRMKLKGKALRVLQVWEQLLPFQGSNTLYSATQFLNSRLNSQAEIDKVQALQNMYNKPKDQHDSKSIPSETYSNPAAQSRQKPVPCTSSGIETYNSDLLMATVSAKMRLKSVRAKLQVEYDNAETGKKSFDKN